MHRQEPVDASNLAADACAPQQQHERLQQQQPQGHAQQQQPPQQQQQQEQQQQQQQQKQQQQQQQQVAQARPPALAFTHPKAGSMVIASLRQQANPIINLKYHRLHPKQLLQRLLPLQRRRELSRRFLLLLNDVEGAHASLAQVILHAFHYGFILLVAASPAEAAELLQQLKASENRASDALQPALDDRHAPRCAEVLRVLPSVNRADFVSLAKEFRCMRNIFKARQQQLQQCPGIGPKKVRVLLAAFEEPFFPDTDDRFTAAAASRSIAAAAAAATEAAAIKDSGETDTAQANTKQPTAALKAITG